MANELTIVIRAKNLLKKGVSGATATLKKLKGVTGRVGKSIAAGFRRAKVALAAFVAGIAAAVKHAEQFRAAMAQVSVMLGQNQKMLGGMTEGIIKMSAEFGESKDALAKGLYDILSAGIDAAGAMDVLRIAMKAAVGGATDVATSVDALTTVINAYGLEAKDATHVSDVLFQVVKDGKVTYAELAENIGKLAPTARAAGLTLENMGAVLAALVKVEKPERAMTALSAAMMAAARQGKDLFTIISENKGKGLEDIVDAGLTRNAAKAVALLANNFDSLQSEIKKFQDTTGAAEEAFKRVEDTRILAKVWQSFLAVVTKLGTAIATQLKPEFEAIVASIKTLMEDGRIDEWARTAADALKVMIGPLKLVAKFIAAVVEGFAVAGTFFKAAKIPGRMGLDIGKGQAAVDARADAQIQKEIAREQAAIEAEMAKKEEEAAKRLAANKAAFEKSNADVQAILAREEARKMREKEKRQKEINKLKEKEKEIVAQIAAEEKKAATVAKQQGVINHLQGEIGKLGDAAAERQRRALQRIPEFIAERKAAQDKEDAKLKEDEKIRKLREKEARRITLSKKDKAFLDAVAQREVMRRQAVLDKDKQRKLEDQLNKEQKKLADLQKDNNKQLRGIHAKIDNLLVMK